MSMILNSCRILSGLLSVFLIFSCEMKTPKFKFRKKMKQEINCSESINLDKPKISLKDKDVIRLFDEIKKIDFLVETKKLTIFENTLNKFGSFTVYNQNESSKKIISEIYVRNLRLASIKHEIYFLDDCNILAKMTKYAYRSKRIKAIYFFSFNKEQSKGCIVETVHTLFRKKGKIMNISDEKVAKDWSKRIYNNIIEPHLNSLNTR